MIPTIKVKDQTGEREYIMINQSDFDPALHEPYLDAWEQAKQPMPTVEETPAPASPKRSHKRKSAPVEPAVTEEESPDASD